MAGLMSTLLPDIIMFMFGMALYLRVGAFMLMLVLDMGMAAGLVCAKAVTGRTRTAVSSMMSFMV